MTARRIARKTRALPGCVAATLLVACGGGEPGGAPEQSSGSRATAARTASAQVSCPATPVASGLLFPLAVTQSALGNLLVSEAGTGASNTGRISIVATAGGRRTLIDGLPSGTADVGDPAGPAGLFLRGRTLYVAIGVGDVLLPGPFPGAARANPSPSSPILSSVLALHFSADVEQGTQGFRLERAHHDALAAGERVVLSDGQGNQLRIERVADFPDYTPAPRPDFADNVRGSNPFDLVAVANRLYVTDGGQNVVRRVDIPTGTFDVLADFPPIPNPLFPQVGPPMSEAVPTGIRQADGQLLVTLFRGAPFAPGTSVVERVDPVSGEHAPLIGGLKMAIDVLPLNEGAAQSTFVLQLTSGAGPFFSGPGTLLRFDAPASAPTVVADCLAEPTSMVRDAKTGTFYITELPEGRVVALSAR